MDTDECDDEGEDSETSHDDEIDWKLGQIWQIGVEKYQSVGILIKMMMILTIMMMMMMMAVMVATFGK